jgi:hypothetical protein
VRKRMYIHFAAVLNYSFLPSGNVMLAEAGMLEIVTQARAQERVCNRQEVRASGTSRSGRRCAVEK